MSYIKSIHIEGFKKFKNFDMSFNPRVNTIVGENESGKSTILEALEIALNQNYKNSEKFILKDLLNKENVEIFKTNPNIANLPEIIIEVELELDNTTVKNLDFSGLAYKNSRTELRCGIHFECKFDMENSEELNELITSGNIPYEYYKMTWLTYNGTMYDVMKRPLKYLSINTSNISSNNSYNYYNRSLFNSTYDTKEKAKIKNDYANKIESLLENVKIDEERKFGINTRKVLLESVITLLQDGVTIENKGSGMENLIKTQIALDRMKTNIEVISIEEPENHLSHTNMKKMLDSIAERKENAQIILTTHNTLIMNGLNLRNVIWIDKEQKSQSLDSITSDTAAFFEKSDNSNLMEFIISEKVIIVEGNTEYMLVNKIFSDLYGENIEKYGIHIISAGGIGYKRYLEVAETMPKKVVVLTDNDKKEKNIENANLYNQSHENIKICMDTDVNRWTWEACIYQDNKELIEKVVSVEEGAQYLYGGKDYGKYLGKMLNNKTEVAYQLLSQSFEAPQYVKDALEWIKE